MDFQNWNWFELVLKNPSLFFAPSFFSEQPYLPSRNARTSSGIVWHEFCSKGGDETNQRILDALKTELAENRRTYEDIYKNSRNLAAQAATAARLEMIRKYFDLIDRLELEEKKKDRSKTQE